MGDTRFGLKLNSNSIHKSTKCWRKKCDKITQSEDKSDGRENIQLQIAPPPPATRPEHNDFT